ncbi:hypothetical protein [Chryseobacterium sp. MFBS3-17]|uniref:hypothetical protein n=1 Tax=Chryseobacterium sp. MFBS3-17 TaxID=2886689 RepID=UPI001D0EF0B7|nr:hypothetical protein [Chryseobacterium sp. MFBS3-17]MCC2590396.1 hypothetical protein [Chryseobacterium sp. MFBS3-17]
MDTKEEVEEFSLSEISTENQSVSNVSIEDVENLNTPKSFNKYQIQKDNNENSNERQSLDELRQLFEAEQDLDDVDFFQENPENRDKQSRSKETEFSDEMSEKEEHSTQDIIINDHNKTSNVSQSKDWKTLLNLSETLVQLVANHDGHKVYHSVM